VVAELGLLSRRKAMTDVAKILAEQEEAASKEIQEALDRGDDPGLKLAPLVVVAFLGVKVALPIVCSFASREVWERYNHIRTRSQAEKARGELAVVATSQTNLDEESVVGPVVDSLREEGVSPEVADRVVRQAYVRIKKEMAPHQPSASS
jgi:hypothetical protein